jgi:hypothetical protein
MRRRVRGRLGLAAWALIVSAAYLVVAMVNGDLAESLVVAFVALLLVPTAAVETREVLRDD